MRKQIELACYNCNKKFNRAMATRKQALVRGKSRPFCSKECSDANSNTKIKINCSCCGKKIQRTNLEILKSKTKRFFCSHKCSATITLNGLDLRTDYRKIAFKEKEKICQECRYDNIYAIEVHHIDKNRANNSIGNLCVLCANCHSLVHKNKLKLTA